MNVDNYYKQLEGFKIKSYLGESKDGFPQFHLTKPKYADVLVEVSADGEGNFGGVLFLSEMEDA
jgi:hypothetical protein